MKVLYFLLVTVILISVSAEGERDGEGEGEGEEEDVSITDNSRGTEVKERIIKGQVKFNKNIPIPNIQSARTLQDCVLWLNFYICFY